MPISLLTQSGYLPQCHSVRPHIRSVCELSIHNGFYSHPLPGKPPFGRLHVDFVARDHSRHSKVRYLQVLVLSDQDISAGQVSVDYIETGEVFLWRGGES